MPYSITGAGRRRAWTNHKFSTAEEGTLGDPSDIII